MTWSPDEPFSLYPGIAEAIKIPEDRKWVEFKIYDEAKFSDGKSIKTFGTAQDHKRVNEGDKGENTGGMGAYSPSKLINKNLAVKISI